MGDVKESTFRGFMETYDPTQHHMAAGAVRARLDAGAVRDEKGYFRVRPGQSTLREKEPVAKTGISLAELEAQAAAERAAREAARRERKRKPAAAEGEDAKRGKAAAAAAEEAAPVAPATWLSVGLVVKSLARDPPALYKVKGVVRRVRRDGAADVELLQGGATHALPAAQLETVLPAPGGRVRVVGGRYAGAGGTLLGVDVDAFRADVRLDTAPHEGLQVQLEYEECCKTEAQ